MTTIITDKLFLDTLVESHAKHKRCWFNRAGAHKFISTTLELLFPHFGSREYLSQEQLTAGLTEIEEVLSSNLKTIACSNKHNCTSICADFFNVLPGLYNELLMDANAIYLGDPAAHSVDEVVLAYPGFYAIAIHRLAHTFYQQGIPIFPRVLSEYAHQMTGIDIHPGATIGRSFCIDHGTGIVIGETTTIGDNVKIYQGVTLGALSVEKELANTKRHPTIENDVVIYAQATILGGNTIIGHHSIIGGNVWLTESVPPFSKVYHRPEISVRQDREELV